MPKNCIVRGCKSGRTNGHPFPLDRPSINAKWIKSLENHQHVPINYETKLVCSAHFVDSDFLKSKFGILTRKAVPSIYPNLPNNYESEDEDDETQTNEIVIKQDVSENYVVEDIELADVKVEIKTETEKIFNNEVEIESDFEIPERSDEEDESERDADDNSEDKTDEASTRYEIKSENIELVPKLEKVDLEIDSDYEPVIEESLPVLQDKVMKKTELLEKERSTLALMEEMLKNQASTILRLENELNEWAKQVPENEEQSTGGGSSNEGNVLVQKLNDYSNVDMQLFAISLFYFSPKVYSYLRSIMPYLPPKHVVIDWVKTGKATILFPTGVLDKEKFNLE